MSQDLQLKVLGKVELRRNGGVLPAIRSKKTRSLLAYLAMTGRAHDREDLCSLLFERTADPRGALRWSISQLRRNLGKDAGCITLVEDRVQFDRSRIDLDIAAVWAATETQKTDVTDLERAAEAIPPHAPLAHLFLSHTPDFNDWAEAEQDKLKKLHTNIIGKLINTDGLAPEMELKWRRLQLKVLPRSQDAAYALWKRLTDLGQHAEAQRVEAEFCTQNGSKPVNFQDKASAPRPQFPRPTQTLGYCTSSDGVNIAYATVGSGPPLVKAANWLNHLELDWQSPIWGDTFEALARENTLVRYDERGNGMSDWDVDDIGFDAFVHDLETVVNHLGLKQFPLLGMSQGCAVSIAFAVRYPERVSALVLVGGYAAGWRIGMTPQEIEEREAVLTLTRHGWGTSNSVYRQIFSQTFMPNADTARLAWFNEFQRRTTSAKNAVRFQQAFGDIDVRDLLHRVRAPTLVLHATDDQRIGIQHGQHLAEAIPNAQMVELDSCNHIILGDEPAWAVLMREINAFLKKH